VGAYALYGVCAIQVILAAIAKSDGTRASITKAVFTGAGITIPASQSILGKAIHISTGQGSGGVAAGDSTAKDITIEQVINNQETTLQAWTVQ
jgi:branched-chain amino acid transport system substrate-binding protein